jgi:hypothetical protein
MRLAPPPLLPPLPLGVLVLMRTLQLEYAQTLLAPRLLMQP